MSQGLGNGDREFLLEIGAEEIPAWMIEPALAELRNLLTQAFEQARLTLDAPLEIRALATPRRLVAWVPALPPRQRDSEELVTGPPRQAPPQAKESFARKLGVPPKKLHVKTTPKGEYWTFLKKEKGRKTEHVLTELLPELILRIHWPKTMYWTGKSGPRFIRPIRSLVALYGGRVVRFSIAGVKSRNTTFGHRTRGNPRLKVGSFEEHGRRLRDNGVILDPAERRQKILEEAGQLLPESHRIRENPALLETLVYLAEFPTAALGSFDASYLSLPEEVLVTVMEHHQKYLAVEKSDGRLAPHFVFVMDRDADPDGLIRHGNERVLRARFSDARFFWETDQKLPLRDRLPLLEHVTFQANLGSYGWKVKRMAALARALAADFGADVEAAARAASLAKCDLTTELVKEFTELQGIVGGLYARAQGEPEKVATAIYDHYRPQSMEEPSPGTPEGAVVSVADKLDTLAGFFRLGLVPSGSKDPYALRRAAQGVVKILADRGCRVRLLHLARTALERQEAIDPAVETALDDFFLDRLRYYLREIRGFAYDEVNAVMAAGVTDVPGMVERCEAIARVRPTENFEPLAVAFKRIKNILIQAGGVEKFTGQPDASLLETGAENDLYEQAVRISKEISQNASFLSVLQRTAQLRPFVDTYFDKVLVMAQDERIRQNRLALLAWLLRNFTRVADFSEIVTTKG